MNGTEQIRRVKISRDRLTQPDGIECLLRFLRKEFTCPLGQDGARREGIDADIVAAEFAGEPPTAALDVV